MCTSNLKDEHQNIKLRLELEGEAISVNELLKIKLKIKHEYAVVRHFADREHIELMRNLMDLIEDLLFRDKLSAILIQKQKNQP